MRTIFDTYKKTGLLHHAYLISGTVERVMPDLRELIESELGFTTTGNPDFWTGDFETFGIDDSRALKELQSRRPFAGERKFFILCARFFTREAQNSLLKVFEEPTAHTHFFIITQNTESLLPTLKSRLFFVRSPRETLADTGKEDFSAADFLKSGKGKRLKLLADMIESKDKNRAILFLNELERSLYEKGTGDAGMSEEVRQTCKDIGVFRSYLNDRSPSVKMILEQVALTAPAV